MTVEPSWVVLGAVILGGLFGLFQIPVWQACVTAGIVIGRVLTTWGRPVIVGWANKLSAMSRFALQGGLTAEDPGAVFAGVRDVPPLIATEQDTLRLTLALFSCLPALMYLIARWRFRIRPTAFGPLLVYRVSKRRRLMACGLGGINGYLIAYFLVPLLFPQPEAIIRVPSGQVVRILDENLVLVLIGFVLILIIFGLQTSGRSRG